jgi:hypothetical protein
VTYLGDFKVGAVFDFGFSTYDKASGAPITLAGSPVVSIYQDNSATEDATGVTLTVDFDARTGQHNVHVDAGSRVAGNYRAVLTAGTVDGVTVVGTVLAEFSIRARAPERLTQLIRFLKYAVGTATQGKIRCQIPKAGGGFAVSADWTPAAADVKVSIDGGAQANIGTVPAFANGAWEFVLTAGELTGKRISITGIDAAPKVIDDFEIVVETFGNASALYPDDWTASSGVAQTGDSYARLGAPVAASVSADIAAVQADTDNLQTRVPAALVGGRMDSSVGSYPGNTVQTGDAFARLGAPAGASTAADVAAVKVDTAAVKTVTDQLVAAQAEPGQGVPAVNATPLVKLAYLFKAWRNKKTQTSTTMSLFNDDAVTVDQKATVSDDGTTATVGEVASGP